MVAVAVAFLCELAAAEQPSNHEVQDAVRSVRQAAARVSPAQERLLHLCRQLVELEGQVERAASGSIAPEDVAGTAQSLAAELEALMAGGGLTGTQRVRLGSKRAEVEELLDAVSSLDSRDDAPAAAALFRRARERALPATSDPQPTLLVTRP